MIAVLLLSVAVPQAASTPPAQPASAKLICKRMAETGSLVGRRKICYTRAEWDSIAAAARASSEQMQSNNMGRPPGS